jgi:3-methyladenine DNA glycosylase AlkD
MKSDIKETITDIRKQCRLAMNGVVSSSMRNQGVSYKLNFGVSLPKIKEISTRYQKNEELARCLWDEDVRELKILATLLYPLNSFDKENACNWIDTISTQEVREQLCVNLLQNLPFAYELTEEVMKSENKEIRLTAYNLFIRLILKDKTAKDIDNPELSGIISDLSDADIRNTALLLLRTMGRFNPSNAKNILSAVSGFQDSMHPFEKEVYDSLIFDFEFYNCL